MLSIKNNTSLANSFKKSSLIAIITTAVLISLLVGYLKYYSFSKHSEQLKSEYIASKKSLVKQEVLRVTEYIARVRAQTQEKIKARIKSRVYEAHSIATNIYNKFKGKLPKHKIKKIIIEALRPLRFFNGDGYYYIHALNGDLQLQALKPDKEGLNRLNFKNADNQYIVRDLLSIVNESGEGFLSYNFFSFKFKKKERAKIAFVKLFKPFNWSIGTGDYLENIEKDIQKSLLEHIERIKFGKNSYIFVVDYDGNILMNASQKHLIGSNMSKLVDANGVNVYLEERKAVKNPEGDFIYYVWSKPSSLMPSPKMSFVKAIPDWRWMVGTGLYIDDVQKTIQIENDNLKNELITQTIYIFFIVIFSSLFIILISNKFSKLFSRETEMFSTFFSKVSEDAEKIDIESLRLLEFKQLAKSANKMLDEKINAEESLHESEENLKETEEQLKRTQKMDALGKLTGGIAHDYNNMMGIVLGYSELLLPQVSGNKKAVEYIDQIYNAGQRAKALTEKLMTFSRYKPSETVVINISDQIQQQQHLLEKTLTSRIKLILDLHEQLWLTRLDPGDFNDAIINMAINTSHAIESSGSMKISTHNSTITEYEAKTLELELGDYITVSLSDSGAGMDEQTISKIFDPFFSTKGDFGTGLGLSQVYGFTKRSDGSIKVISESGDGTEFILYFPRYNKNTEIKELEEPEEESVEPGNATILVVDDEESLCDVACKLLSLKGYRVLKALNAKQALEILKNETVDLVFSDIVMPQMTGYELATEIADKYPDVIIQLTSGYNDAKKLNPDIDIANFNILSKPYSRSDLLKRIQQVLANK